MPKRPAFVSPQLLTLADRPPSGDEWFHEIKHDGYRTQLVLDGHDARAFHPQRLRLVRPIPAARQRRPSARRQIAVIDGEVVLQDGNGREDFHGNRRALHRSPERLVMFAFDLLHIDGHDLRSRPVEERRALLWDLLDGASGPIAFSDSFDGDGAAFFAAAEKAGLEGIVSKRRGSRYVSKRAESWIKTKAFTVSEFAVVGAHRTPERIPAALLAAADEDGHYYAGSAFVTLPADDRDRFWRYVENHHADRPAVDGVLKSGATWVRPGLAVAVRHLRSEDMLSMPR